LVDAALLELLAVLELLALLGLVFLVPFLDPLLVALRPHLLHLGRLGGGVWPFHDRRRHRSFGTVLRLYSLQLLQILHHFVILLDRLAVPFLNNFLVFHIRVLQSPGVVGRTLREVLGERLTLRDLDLFLGSLLLSAGIPSELGARDESIEVRVLELVDLIKLLEDFQLGFIQMAVPADQVVLDLLLIQLELQVLLVRDVLKSIALHLVLEQYVLEMLLLKRILRRLKERDVLLLGSLESIIYFE